MQICHHTGKSTQGIAKWVTIIIWRQTSLPIRAYPLSCSLVGVLTCFMEIKQGKPSSVGIQGRLSPQGSSWWTRSERTIDTKIDDRCPRQTCHGCNEVCKLRPYMWQHQERLLQTMHANLCRLRNKKHLSIRQKTSLFPFDEGTIRYLRWGHSATNSFRWVRTFSNPKKVTGVLRLQCHITHQMLVNHAVKHQTTTIWED